MAILVPDSNRKEQLIPNYKEIEEKILREIHQSLESFGLNGFDGSIPGLLTEIQNDLRLLQMNKVDKNFAGENYWIVKDVKVEQDETYTVKIIVTYASTMTKAVKVVEYHYSLNEAIDKAVSSHNKSADSHQDLRNSLAKVLSRASIVMSESEPEKANRPCLWIPMKSVRGPYVDLDFGEFDPNSEMDPESVYALHKKEMYEVKNVKLDPEDDSSLRTLKLTE